MQTYRCRCEQTSVIGSIPPAPCEPCIHCGGRVGASDEERALPPAGHTLAVDDRGRVVCAQCRKEVPLAATATALPVEGVPAGPYTGAMFFHVAGDQPNAGGVQLVAVPAGECSPPWTAGPSVLREVSRPFGELAETIHSTLPRNAERSVALRKLLEAKDAAVRAKVAK